MLGTCQRQCSRERSLEPLSLASPMPYAYIIRRHGPYLLQDARPAWHIVWHRGNLRGRAKSIAGQNRRGTGGGTGACACISGAQIFAPKYDLGGRPPSIAAARPPVPPRWLYDCPEGYTVFEGLEVCHKQCFDACQRQCFDACQRQCFDAWS